MKQLLITTTAVVVLAGCGKRERTHGLSEDESKPLETVHTCQKIISKQALSCY
ncbi:lipoprotein [bacterium]|nr:lipoprotein [bacterium]